MLTVAEIELENKISELVAFVREYAVNKKDDFTLVCKRDNVLLLCVDKEVTIDFTV